MNPYMALVCCGVRAAEQALIDAGIPVPAISQAIHHEPVLDCTCDALYVRVLDSADTTDERTGFDMPRAGLMANGCVINTRSTLIEVSLTRCVHLHNPLTGDCWPSGDCTETLTCDNPGPPRPQPGDCDRQAAPSKAWETAWLLHDRWVLETAVAPLWSRCLCDDPCTDGCSPVFGCHKQVRWVGSQPHDSGGCAGTIATYRIDWP